MSLRIRYRMQAFPLRLRIIDERESGCTKSQEKRSEERRVFRTQGGLESRYVCVNVAEDQIPHASVPITVANYRRTRVGLHEIARKKIGRASCLPNSGRLGEPLRLRECR